MIKYMDFSCWLTTVAAMWSFIGPIMLVICVSKYVHNFNWFLI